MSRANVYSFLGSSNNDKRVKDIAFCTMVSKGNTYIKTNVYKLYINNQNPYYIKNGEYILQVTGSPNKYNNKDFDAIDESISEQVVRSSLFEKIEKKYFTYPTTYTTLKINKICVESILTKKHTLRVSNKLDDDLKLKFATSPIKTKLIVKVKEQEEDEDENTGDGSNLKSLNFVIQKGIYVEIDLDFIKDDIDIDSIVDLPIGLEFKNNKIKGTTVNSGNFVFYIIVSDGSTIECHLEVPPIIRLS